MARYIHQITGWPDFFWNHDRLAGVLAEVHRREGRLRGRMESLGFTSTQEAVLRTLTEDVLKTSEIEGEKFDAGQVRSSIARRLGIDIGGLKRIDRSVEGVVEMMLDATGNYGEPLTRDRLFAWHAAMFPAGRSGMKRLKVGAWRDDSNGPMQVVSGPLGRERVHYQAPAAAQLEEEMAAFLNWFNGRNETDSVVKAGLAHLWLVTIHPFDDGNGRIARAVADMALARSEQSAQRFYSMSAQIRHERETYYDVLEQTQKGTLEVTRWMEWFLECLRNAIDGAETTLANVLQRGRFWANASEFPLNSRQHMMLGKLLEGFEGKLTASKWAALAKCSHDSALRDIASLMAFGLLARSTEGGRNTSYELVKVD